MDRRTVGILAGFLAATVAGRAESPFAGTWQGTENDLPAVELTIRNDNGKISGAIGFYFQTRGDDGKWRLGEKTAYTVPLLSPRLDGSVLTFETIHQKKHGSPELGPNNRYRVHFTGPKEAVLKIFKEGTKENDSQPGFKLTLRE
jgi:hypothetical protein